MNLYQLIAFIVTVSALFAYLNFRFIRLPTTIGIMVLSLCTSMLLVVLGRWWPGFSDLVVRVVESIDFHDLLLNFMLSFLLFAGAIHINAARLRKERLPVLSLAVLSTILSTIIVGGLLYFTFGFFGLQVEMVYCLLFGALISPTDPIAVLGILKKARIPQSLEMKISGESLFNDGIGVVIFLVLAKIASAGVSSFSSTDIALLFLREAGGGLLFGVALGYVGFFLLRSIDSYQVEVLITLAIVMGGYTLATALHVSGPLAMVMAGIITGNQAKEYGMSRITRDYLGKFWELVDEILNAVLFLLIGFEMLVVPTNGTIIAIGLIAIVLVLLARYISVALPVLLLRKWVVFERHAVKMLTWGGLRGGISVALALSLPREMYRDQFVAITYLVVVFSIVVQGLSIGKLATRLKMREEQATGPDVAV